MDLALWPVKIQNSSSIIFILYGSTDEISPLTSFLQQTFHFSFFEALYSLPDVFHYQAAPLRIYFGHYESLTFGRTPWMEDYVDYPKASTYIQHIN
jgi:hypothetical protein